VALYLIAAYLCLRAARRAPDLGDQSVRGRTAFFWIACSTLLVILGINKQLDLQTLLTNIGRAVAREGGWYEQRREVQRAFVKGLLLASGGVFLVCGVLMRRALRRLWPALAGIILLAAFVLVRAVSFYHVDHVLSGRLAGVKVRTLMELGGIACVGMSALLNAVRPRQAREKRPSA